MAGLPPGRWRGRGLAGLGLSEGAEVSERHMALVFGQGRHPNADRIEQRLLDDGADSAAARRATVLGQPIEEIEARNQTPLLALDFTFRPQVSLTVLWAPGDAHTRRVIERAHERAVAQALRWLEDDVAETRWASGRGRARTPALVVAAFRHFDNRDGFPLLHEHCLILNRVQHRGGDGEPRWGALGTTRLYQNVVAAGTLYSLAMTTEVCEELGLATVPREVTPGLRPVMEIAGVDAELIAWSSTRRQRIEDALEGLTYTWVQEHGRLPGEKARHGLGWQAAQDTRPEKKTPRPLEQLLAWWRASAVLKFGRQVVDGLLDRCRTVGAALRARVDPVVDTAFAAVDVAAVVFTVRRNFARRHVLAEARRHLLETLRGRAFAPGLDDDIANRALADHARQTTVPQPGRRVPAADQIFYTADFTEPDPWFIAGTGGRPPRESSRYERARVASLAVRNAIRTARTATPQPRRHRPPRTPSNTPAGTSPSHRRSGRPPSTPTNRLRCPTYTWEAGRQTRRRGCAHRRTWPGSPPTPARPTPAAAPSRTDRPRPPTRAVRSTSAARSTNSSTGSPARTKARASSRDSPPGGTGGEANGPDAGTRPVAQCRDHRGPAGYG
ncbi:MobF family relaxase [Streptomyces microflavus]|uniref:MobF family relaxase n=1 Tax=Streptomyces microflavus TaxID=1919 RepID=UPI00340293F0